MSLEDINIDSLISYLEENLYTHTGFYYPATSPFGINSIYYVLMNVPFICKFTYDIDADIPYQLDWNFYIKPTFVPEIYYNVSSKSTFQLTSKGDYYWLFDFSMRQFDFVIYKNGIDNFLTSEFQSNMFKGLKASKLNSSRRIRKYLFAFKKLWTAILIS
jgi:hypothetical protein